MDVGEEQIDTGDAVLHGPTGEEWLVAYVRGDRLAWCGWPEGEAALSDCALVRKATPAQRDKLLEEMAASSGTRARYAQQRRAAASIAAASEAAEGKR
jgi:hypothetical protein